MKEMLPLISLALLSVLLAFVFVSRLFAIGGINPDLPLLFFALLMVLPPKRRMPPGHFFLLVAVFSAALFFLGTFWLPEVVVFAALLILFFLGSRFLPGNWFFDFLAIQIAAVFVFYAASAIILKSPFSLSLILLEILYNIALSLILWPIGRKIVA